MNIINAYVFASRRLGYKSKITNTRFVFSIFKGNDNLFKSIFRLFFKTVNYFCTQKTRTNAVNKFGIRYSNSFVFDTRCVFYFYEKVCKWIHTITKMIYERLVILHHSLIHEMKYEIDQSHAYTRARDLQLRNGSYNELY